MRNNEQAVANRVNQFVNNLGSGLEVRVVADDGSVIVNLDGNQAAAEVVVEEVQNEFWGQSFSNGVQIVFLVNGVFQD